MIVNELVIYILINVLLKQKIEMFEQGMVVAAEFEKVLAQLRPVIDTDLRRVEDAAEAAGAPWTSGRVPVWKP